VRSKGPVVVVKRQNPRVEFGGAALVEEAGTTYSGELRNISIGGALFVSGEPFEVPAGTGVQISFRLPAGLSVRTAATLRWSRIDDATGAGHFGLEFIALGATNQAFLESYVDSMSHLPTTDRPPVDASVVPKYAVHWDDAERLVITLAGLICLGEAREVARQVREALGSARRERIRFQIDVRGLSVCAQDVTHELRSCFEALNGRGEALGLLVGASSLAYTQVMRSVRETGLADVVFCAADPSQASEIWRQLEG
jgi:hypothetical protein